MFFRRCINRPTHSGRQSSEKLLEAPHRTKTAPQAFAATERHSRSRLPLGDGTWTILITFFIAKRLSFYVRKVPPAPKAVSLITLWRALTRAAFGINAWRSLRRSEEHTSELQSLMRISYAVFCLKKKHRKINIH